MATAILAFAFAPAGCTVQDRYQSIRDDKLQECSRQVTERQREECRARLAPASYEEYERLRRTVPKPGR